MKKLFILFAFIFFSYFLNAQDVVYDSLRGNPNNWLRIKGGPQEKTIHLVYENLGILTKSKVLTGAGIIDGLIENVNYKMYYFNYDTLSFEIKTDQLINCIVYKYIYNDTLSKYFIGLRKSPLGSNMFDGQYMLISPLTEHVYQTNVYNGIGSTKTLILSLKPNELTDLSIKDYELSNQVTLQSINSYRYLRASKTENFITNINETYNDIEVWPNPVKTLLTLKSSNKIKVRIHNHLSILMYDKNIEMEITTIDFSSFKNGMYYMMIMDESDNLIKIIKIVKI